MTIVKGQIESLTRIKAELNQRGIKRFSSVGDINSFIKNYELEKQAIIRQIELDLNLEIDALRLDISKLKENYETLKTEETSKLTNEILTLNNKHDQLKSGNRNSLIKAVYFFYLRYLKFRIKRLEKNFDKIIIEKTASIGQKIFETNQKLNDYTTNKERVITGRSQSKISELTFTKEVVDDLYPLIAGAIGENLVVKELKKLSDKHILYNDFSIVFDKPIYNKKEKDKIFSIQIDHLLVTNSGVFIIETKNWSKESIENLDLRSPVKQIMRTNHAVFKILNYNQKNILNKHHWGEKRIPILSLIVMIKNKPRALFKYVEVKTLNEINKYITHLTPIFEDSEVTRISKYLEKLKNQSKSKTKIKRYSSDSITPIQRKIGVSSKPALRKWLKNNPGKGINDYYAKFGV